MLNALPPNSQLKWNNLRDWDGKYAVPYEITGSYSNQEKEVIYDAMKTIDKNTCIRFKHRTSEEDYVDIQNSIGEGRTNNIYPPRCIKYDVVIHEMLHVLGLWHEHMRNDRDKYVKVHEENVLEGYQNQFGKLLSTDAYTYGVPYDYLSIMHYEKNAFAKPGTITLETLDKCKDKDVACGGLLNKGMLNCSDAYYSNLCCASCKLLIEAIAFNRRTTQQPNTRLVSRESLPPPLPDFSAADSIYRCEDKEPVRCKELAENHLLKCLTEIADVNLCCRTCNRILDYLVIILIDREILDNVTGLDERFVLPEGKLSVICGVASANSFGSSKWTYSSVVTIQTSSAIPSINDNEPITPIDYKRLTADDLSMDQLLKLIHSSHVEDLPSKLIESSPGMRFVVTPKSEVGSSSADISVDSFVVNSQLETTSPLPTLLSSAVDSEDVVKLEPELSEDAVGPDYKLVEERVRQAIGADEPSSIEKLRYLQAFGLIDRVL
ncbi:hypothetical protein RB195_004678 [Necator americanus]|uniref:Metalloendopeptidase n=1 Tax=Necator americanus TaxID=51031 RepID=A0ABR1BMP7_NECAM